MVGCSLASGDNKLSTSFGTTGVFPPKLCYKEKSQVLKCSLLRGHYVMGAHQVSWWNVAFGARQNWEILALSFDIGPAFHLT